jgi:hypothetical protein
MKVLELINELLEHDMDDEVVLPVYDNPVGGTEFTEAVGVEQFGLGAVMILD